MSDVVVAAPARVRFRLGGEAAVVVGGVLVGIALLADLRPGVQGGTFGMGQALATLVGLATILLGVDVRSGRADRWVASLAEARATAGRLAAILAQLALLALLARWYQVESPAFARVVLPLAASAFLLHHLLPLEHRLGYFIAISLVGFITVLGWANAAWIVVVVAGFAALCHVPVSWARRTMILLLAGAALGVLRARPEWTPFSSALWPILGSILMFRLIVYAYDVRHATDRVPARWSLAYFFVLPNVVFPLFPVLDFATFRRTYYDREATGIYQRGVEWMVRGLLHLLLYRAVYQHLTLAPSEVASGALLVQYMVSTFLLYLRVSGTFHFIIGILHLFGFRLPETHRFFYLAASFSDFWRRINIYWKDFMMKVVFYPVFFRLRKKGETTALVVATATVFLVTWLTHSYQWFWILGQWLLSWTDGLFWAILGVLLIANSLWEAKRGRKRVLPGQSRRSVRDAASTAVKAVLVFATICILWSLWGSPTLADWFDLIAVPRFAPADWLAVAGVLGIVAIAAFLSEITGRSQGDADRASSATSRPWGLASLQSGGQLAAIALVTTPWVMGGLPTGAQEFARDMRVPELNKQDAVQLQRGYYENLQGVSLQNSQLWELYAQRPAEGEDIWRSGVLRERADYLGRDMKPLFGTFSQGRSFRTNRWGMRDRDYALAKPTGMRRIALLGQSYVAGDGVADGETFDELVEDELARSGAACAQILNFAVGSYSQIQQLLLLDDRVWQFSPDVVLVVGNPTDMERLVYYIVQQVRRGVAPPFDTLRLFLERADVTPALRESEAVSRLLPHGPALLAWTHREIVRRARERGVHPVWVYLSTPEHRPREDVDQMTALARTAGYQVLDWSDVYDGAELSAVQVSKWDRHPNAAGHRMIAARLQDVLRSDPTFGCASS